MSRVLLSRCARATRRIPSSDSTVVFAPATIATSGGLPGRPVSHSAFISLSHLKLGSLQAFSDHADSRDLLHRSVLIFEAIAAANTLKARQHAFEGQQQLRRDSAAFTRMDDLAEEDEDEEVVTPAPMSFESCKIAEASEFFCSSDVETTTSTVEILEVSDDDDYDGPLLDYDGSVSTSQVVYSVPSLDHGHTATSTTTYTSSRRPRSSSSFYGASESDSDDTDNEDQLTTPPGRYFDEFDGSDNEEASSDFDDFPYVGSKHESEAIEGLRLFPSKAR